MRSFGILIIMRKFLFIFFLSFLLLNVSGQIITGYVIDEETKRKISQSLIYFDGTFHRTMTDIHGNFSFDISEYPLMPVTVSSPGYYSVSFDAEPSEKPVQILLKPKLPESNEASGKSEEQEKERNENLKQFKNIILGKTHNALSCKIINENEIIFTTDNNIVKAYASGPLLIHNEALGFKASYYLDKFVLNTEDENFFYSGNILFNEDLASEVQNKKYIKKRGEAYLKSRTYFFRLLWADRLDSAGFIVKNALNEDLLYNNIVIDKGSEGKYLKHINKMNGSDKEISTYIVFLEKEAVYDSWGRLDISCITEITLQNDIYFDRKGYFDPTGISWRGKLAKQRIADLLPLEY